MSARIAFFDIDGTLLDGDCGVLFARHCALRGLLGLRELAASASWLARAALGRIDEAAVVEAKRVALRFQLHIGEARAQELLERCFVEDILPRRRRAVLELVAAQQRAGEVVLVTANMRDFALHWGRELGIPADRCYGAEGLRRGGLLTDELVGPVPLGEERARLVRGLLRERAIEPAVASAFGDSVFDEPMLRAVGSPCAVYPSRALRATALREGWRILDAG